MYCIFSGRQHLNCLFITIGPTLLLLYCSNYCISSNLFNRLTAPGPTTSLLSKSWRVIKKIFWLTKLCKLNVDLPEMCFLYHVVVKEMNQWKCLSDNSSLRSMSSICPPSLPLLSQQPAQVCMSVVRMRQLLENLRTVHMLPVSPSYQGHATLHCCRTVINTDNRNEMVTTYRDIETGRTREKWQKSMMILSFTTSQHNWTVTLSSELSSLEHISPVINICKPQSIRKTWTLWLKETNNNNSFVDKEWL